MFRILEQQAPPKQTASDTINTLSGRLQSATLLEDRRTAILGLRSFAKLYPASVASGALRNLINSLSTDGEDADTIKIVLETLLMLFSPDETSPEASDEIALWLADEFTQRQENITVLLDLLEQYDFFCRLYSLQLISAISSARPERTQECVYTAPLGVSRLVAILEDKREAIQSETILLLISLTPSSQELQKLVAFENAFDRVFAIIESEGSLSRGGMVVQDCLSLLANLLRLNISNQSFFRETGGIPKAANLLRQVIKEESSGDENQAFMSPQKDKNIWGFLSVLRLFLQGGSAGTQMNQVAFWQHGVTFAVLDIGFAPSMSPAIRSEALFTCADLVRANGSLQEKLAPREVPIRVPLDSTPSSTPKPTVNGQAKEARRVTVNVIEALIDVALAVTFQESLDIRLAACECLKAYLQGHAPIRHFFLKRAREGHLSDEPEVDNIFTILVDDGSQGNPDPYRHWIASILLFHLLYDDYDAKKIAMDISEGDAEKGEEVVTCIQSLSANMISCAQRGNDERITVSYLTLLCGWLFEDPEAINDFLQEGSNVQSLIQLVLHPQQDALASGLCAFLLGIIYEFSSKDSPIPRTKLHELLTSRLGRDQFNDKLTKLREHPSIRDFEVLPQGYVSDAYGGPPEIPFDKLFVEFLKDNFSRISRSLDRDPGMEVPVIANGVQRGISRELVDSLKSQVDDKNSALQKALSQIINLEQKLGQEQADLRKAKESSVAELNRIKNINDGLQRNHEQEFKQLHQRREEELKQLQQRHDDEKKQIHQSREDEMKQIRQRYEGERQQLQQSRDGETRQLRETHTKILSDQQRSHQSELDGLRTEVQEARSEAAANLKSRDAALELEKDALKQEHEAALGLAKNQHQEAQKKFTSRVKELEDEAKKTLQSHAKELQSKSRLGDQEKRLKEQEKMLKEQEKQIKEQDKQTKEQEKRVKDQEKQIKELEKRLKDQEKGPKGQGDRAKKAEEEAKKAGEKVAAAEKDAKEKEEARVAAQTELDDLFMVLADLEEKRARDKERLKALGEEVSGEEDNGDEEDDDGDEEDEDEDEDEDEEDEDEEDAKESSKTDSKTDSKAKNAADDDVD